jgi:hypothetical protein
MSAPTLDRHPGSSQAGSSNGRRRSRKQLVLVASALIVLALAVGTSLAVATRPVARQDPAATTPVAAAEDQNTNTNANQPQTEAPEQGTTGNSGNSGDTGSGSKDVGTGAAAQVLPEGVTPAYITEVDSANDRIVVDVVQVFHDDEAVKAAIADGKSPKEAKYLIGWIRNENPRLRTVPLAGNLDVKLMGSCEDSENRAAVLKRLADHAKRKGGYYFDLTVAGGQVTRIQERMVINAC